ncbi:MAG: hypothetical protein ACI4TE_04350 [Alphaproteobacteria bacterium]
MKIRLFFYVWLLTCFACPVFAVQKVSRSIPAVVSDNSDDWEKPEMAVRIDEGRPVYIHKNRTFDCSGAVNHGGGCTRVVFYAAINGLKLTTGGAIREIGLVIGLKDVEVEISSDLQKGSCLFDAVLKHELTHLALHRRILTRFAPEIAKAVLALSEKLPAPLTQAQINKIDKVLGGFVTRMMAEDKKQNELMDSQDAYLHLQNQCRE